MTCWLLSWDNVGLEAIVNLTELYEQFVFDSLAKENAINPIPGMIDRLELRARYNPSRAYEIYSIHIEEEMDKDQIIEYFDTNPLEFKKLIRNRAIKRLFP